jgi:iron complex transport system ATP-binding protein
MSSNVLEIKNLEIGFNKTLIKPFSANLESGKLIALMGSNGAGKSCLLKTICRLQEKKSGQIILEGRELESYSLKEQSNKMAVVLTDKIYSDGLLTLDFISLGRSPYTGWNSKLSTLDLKIIEDVISNLKMEDFKKTFYADLSDGQKQKAHLARALVQDPKLLLLDEPTTFLDIPSKIDLMNNFKKIIQSRNKSILMSTHDLLFLQELIDEIWLIDLDGNMHIGSPKELNSSGLFKKIFGLNLY